MKEGDIVLFALPQADGRIKNRPAVILRIMPRYGDALVCGVSTKIWQEVKGFDELINEEDDDFAASGLLAKSVIRLGFLSLLPQKQMMGSIGFISPERRRRLLQNLTDYLLQENGREPVV